jgi:hypothetical protein
MSRRALWPREHGAYFQLALPLATACVRHIPTVATLALATSACLAFLANEPLLVWLGHRGQRMRDVDGRRARSRLAVLAAGALGLGVLGLALAPDPTLAAAAAVAGPVALVVVLAWRRAERTVAGELIAAIALTGASVPVLVAGGSALGAALALWLSWSVGFGATVLAIHRVIARHKRPAAPIDRVLALGLLATAVAGGAGAWPGSATAAPLAALAALLVIAPPSAARLRAIGVATAAIAAVSSVVAWIVVA